MKKPSLIDDNLALANLPHQVITIAAAMQPEDSRLRVAAYARVSSSSEDQQNSFAAQNTYYTSHIANHANWTLVDIYADPGITGTSAAKRPDFQRMLSDCRQGKIDRILVKSISRFARNTKECLESIRELRDLGISIYFEEQNIDTGTMTGEMMTAMFAAMAQAESESISGNMRLGVRMRMKNGQFNTCFAPFGFCLKNGKLEIIPEEAAVVQRIFQEYLLGKSSREIAKEMDKCYPQESPWRRERIEYILKNERYAGNALLLKRYRTGSFPTKQIRNRGEEERYFISNSNEAIIDQETFDAVQVLREKKAHHRGAIKHDLAGKVQCGGCGATFRAKICRSQKYWVCRTHEEHLERCPIRQIPESVIQEAFLKLHYKLKNHSDEILEPILQEMRKVRERRMLWSPDIIHLNKKISNLISQNQTLTQLKEQGLVDSDIFISRSNALAEKLRTAKLEKERLLRADADITISQTEEILDVLADAPIFLDFFDAELFGELIEMIIVESNE